MRHSCHPLHDRSAPFFRRRAAAVLAGALLMLAAAPCPPALARDISLDPGNYGAPPANARERSADVVMHAMGLAGLRYAYGGTSATSGMDCSALVQHVFRHAWQRELPRTSEEISRAGDQLLARELAPGDLVFFDTLGRPYSHVGIYVGENRFVHAPAAGGAIRLDSLELPYWKTRYNGARRIVDTQLAGSRIEANRIADNNRR